MDHLSSTILMCAILLLFYATGTVKGAVFGGSCSVVADCSYTNSACTSSSCACSDASFRNTANDTCVTKVALEALCVTGQPDDQCADNLAECKDASGLKCLCKDDNYKSTTGCKAQVDVNATCINTETSTTQCSDANSACSDDGASGYKCLCKSTYYGESSTTCTLRKKPTEGCELYQCVGNATCSTPGKTCACNTGYKATATSCEIVAFGDSCTIDIGCGEDNNVCSNSTCVCSDTSPRNAADNACVTKSDAATIMLAHMHVFIFGTVASLYFLV